MKRRPGPQRGAQRRPWVLIVDDDQSMGELITECLEKKGYQCAWTGKGYRGLELMRAGMPDLVLLDINLENMSGLEILAIRERDERMAAVPVILMTAFGNRSSVSLAAALGAYQFFNKPIDMQELETAIHKPSGNRIGLQCSCRTRGPAKGAGGRPLIWLRRDVNMRKMQMTPA